MKKLLIILFLIFLIVSNVKSQVVNLVKDIVSTGNQSSSPSNSIVIGSTLYFTAITPENGRELWKSDGTSGGTVLVKDIYPGVLSSDISGLTNVNGTLFFAANDGVNGTELWKSDGTASGTVPVKDIQLGNGGSNPRSLTNVNGTLFFAANDGVNGTELWKSNGTSAGTVLVKDIVPGSFSSSLDYFVNGNGTLYFAGGSPVELWKSDGTSGGTVLVKEIYPGVGSFPIGLVFIGSTLFFTASSEVNGRELWKSNGTTAGTVLLADIISGLSSSDPTELFNGGGTLYFTASTSANGRELWKSDGTTTSMVHDIVTGSGSSSPEGFAYVGGTLYFSAFDGDGAELWKSNGTSGTTSKVKDIYPGSISSNPEFITVVGSSIFFRANDGTNGIELWKSDGTSGGTTLVKDISLGSNSSGASNFVAMATTLFFSASDPSFGNELWKSDGTSNGTVMVKDINSANNDASISAPVKFNNQLYFSALSGAQLWKTDGTGLGTLQISTSGSPNIGGVTLHGNELFFGGGSDRELWKSNGSTTELVKNIFATGSSNPANFVSIDGFLYFSATDSDGTELWKTDGTNAGTVKVKDIRTGSASSSPQRLTKVGSTLYFIANDGVNGIELWKSDGTDVGTLMVKDILTGGGNSNPNFLTEFNGLLFFSASDNSNGIELWKSDGTSGGTVMVKDIRSVGSSEPLFLTVYNSTLYFSANDGVNGVELWKSDGTTSGTVLLKNIASGSGNSSPENFIVSGGFLYFTASDNFGIELWQTDGSVAGTVMIKDIIVGAGSSSPGSLKEINGTLYFRAFDGFGSRLYKSNGTSAGTIAATSAGDSYQFPGFIEVVNSRVTFYARNNNYGSELFSVMAEPNTQPTSFTSSAITSSSFNISFAPASGNPSGYLAIRKIGSSPTGIPIDGPALVVGNPLGDGTVAYVGSASSISQSGLLGNTNYFYDIFAYNYDGVAYVYRPYNPLEGSVQTLSTAPTSQPTNLNLSSITSTSFNVSFTASSPSSDGYLVVRRTGNPPTGIPVPGVTYNVNDPLGDGIVVFVGAVSFLPFSQASLANGTQYFFNVFSYNGSGSTINYFTSSPLSGSAITLPAVPVAIDATNMTSTSFKAKWETANGADAYVIDVSTVNNFATHINGYPKDVGNVLEETVSGLQASTTYFYKVLAKKLSSESPYSNTISVTTNDASGGSPQIIIGTISYNDLASGQASSSISVEVTGGTGTKTAQIFHRKITNTGAHTSLNMSNSTGNTFTADLPSSSFDELGVEFYISASDASGNPPVNSATRYIYKSFTQQTASNISSIVRFGGTQKSYQIISIPFKLDNNNIAEIFEPVLGAYDKTKWRLVRYQNGKNTDYKAGVNIIEQGKSYWFNSLEQVSIKPGSGTTPQQNQSAPFVMALAQGWNQVATPYPFNIDWDDVLAANSNPAGVGNYKVFNSGELTFAENNVLKPYEGGFVFADNATSLNLPVTLKNTAGGRKSSNILGNDIDAEAWHFPLTIIQMDVVNRETGVGMHPKASLGKDQYDDVTVPRFIQYLEGNFYHPEFFWPKFSLDVVPTREAHEWTMSIETNGAGPITVQWDNTGLASAQSGLYLFYEEDGLLIDMRKQSSLVLPEQSRRDLKLIYTHSGEFIPSRTLLGKPWPNPANNEVNIPFVLGGEGNTYQVSVDVFDMKGTRVVNVVNGLYDAGAHTAQWNSNTVGGNPVSNGLYLVKLKVNGRYLPEYSKIIINRNP